jgi:hypothetical protein
LLDDNHIHQLFTDDRVLRPAALEDLLKKEFPELNKLVVCVADRKIYRQTPKHTPSSLCSRTTHKAQDMNHH